MSLSGLRDYADQFTCLISLNPHDIRDDYPYGSRLTNGKAEEKGAGAHSRSHKTQVTARASHLRPLDLESHALSCFHAT